MFKLPSDIPPFMLRMLCILHVYEDDLLLQLLSRHYIESSARSVMLCFIKQAVISIKYALSICCVLLLLYYTMVMILNRLATSPHVITFFNSVLRPFQDYISSYETDQSVGRRKRKNSLKNHLAHPQAELGLSHMWHVRVSSD